MQRFEYKVVPAPTRGVKVKGLKTTEERFAHALSEAINLMARDGWEYQRTDTLPCEERVGLTGRTTRFQNMLVFRRPLPEAEETGKTLRAVNITAAPPAGPETAEVRAERISATLAARAPEGSAPALTATKRGGEAPRVGPARDRGTPLGGGKDGQPAE